MAKYVITETVQYEMEFAPEGGTGFGELEQAEDAFLTHGKRDNPAKVRFVNVSDRSIIRGEFVSDHKGNK